MSDYDNGTPETSVYQTAREQLEGQQYRWVVTGVAGFIGSHLLQSLLELGQRVVGVDNFLTGYRHNLDQVRELVGPGCEGLNDMAHGKSRDDAG
jgi:UDP-N-acetylglucosamine 4-epimerase